MPRHLRSSSFLVLGIWFLVLPSGCGRNPAATSSSASATRSGNTPVSALVFSPDGKKLAASVGPTATVWDTESAKALAALENAAPALSCLAFSPDGKTVAGGIGKTINVWNVETGKVEKTLSGHS